jgi:deoxyribodipyrimidine photolyase-like uncharacterized protein
VYFSFFGDEFSHYDEFFWQFFKNENLKKNCLKIGKFYQTLEPQNWQKRKHMHMGQKISVRP